MNWTPEERAIINQAIEDLTVKEPGEVVQSMLQESLSKALGRKIEPDTLGRVKQMVTEVLKEALDPRDDFTVEVERDPVDPCRVSVNVSIRPVMPIIIPFEEDP